MQNFLGGYICRQKTYVYLVQITSEYRANGRMD